MPCREHLGHVLDVVGRARHEAADRVAVEEAEVEALDVARTRRGAGRASRPGRSSPSAPCATYGERGVDEHDGEEEHAEPGERRRARRRREEAAERALPAARRLAGSPRRARSSRSRPAQLEREQRDHEQRSSRRPARGTGATKGQSRASSRRSTALPSASSSRIDSMPRRAPPPAGASALTRRPPPGQHGRLRVADLLQLLLELLLLREPRVEAAAPRRARRACPRSTMRPSSSTTIWSAFAHASRRATRPRPPCGPRTPRRRLALDRRLGLGVDARERVVEDQDARAGARARARARCAGAGRPRASRRARRRPCRSRRAGRRTSFASCARSAASRDARRIGRRQAVGDVLGERHREQERVLRDHRDARAQRAQRDAVHVDAVEEELRRPAPRRGAGSATRACVLPEPDRPDDRRARCRPGRAARRRAAPARGPAS